MSDTSWAYGVTTCRERAGGSNLRRTLASLAAGGFADPRIFVDGAFLADLPEDLRGGYETTVRHTNVRTVGNFVLGLWELWIRNPTATYFAMFQDDFVTVKGLREYLELAPLPEGNGYRNLYTFASNESARPEGLKVGWYEARVLRSTHNPDRFQSGRGAVALVFDRAGVEALLSSPILVRKPTDLTPAPDRLGAMTRRGVPKGVGPDGEGERPWVKGEKTLDGCVVTAMNTAGYREWVHAPSLVQHTGERSSMQNLPHQQSPSFPGETADAREWLKS